MSQIKSNGSDVRIDAIREYKPLPYSVTRKVLKQDELEEITGYDRQHASPSANLLDGIRQFDCKNMVYEFCPVLRWLPAYKVKKNLMGDLISGMTVAVMHIPQG